MEFVGNLAKLYGSKVLELNQRRIGPYVSLTQPFLKYNGSLSLTLVNFLASTYTA